MSRLDKLLAEYAYSHQNVTNKRIHWVCVPLILFSAIGLLWSLPIGSSRVPASLQPIMNWGAAAIVLATIYYLSLSVQVALRMLGLMAIMGFVSGLLHRASPSLLWQLCLGIFALSWVAQFYGHKIESRKPSFLRNMEFLLVGPIWVLRHFFGADKSPTA